MSRGDIMLNLNEDLFEDIDNEETLKENVVSNARNWLIDKEGKTPKEAIAIINKSSPEEIEKIALKYTKGGLTESYVGEGHIIDSAIDYFAEDDDSIDYIGSDGDIYIHDRDRYMIKFSDGYSDIIPKEYIELDESLKEDINDIVEIDIPVLNIDTEEIDVSDTEPKGPEVGEDTGLTDLLLSLINGENDTIRDYNTFKANLTSHSEFISVIEDITAEEMNHVGMLQTLLKELSPNAENIEQGKLEAEEDLKDENKEEIIMDPASDIVLTTDLVDDVDDEFYSRYVV